MKIDMISDNFKRIVQQKTEDFSKLLSLMQNNHKEKGEKLLCLLNHIIDFYIYQNEEDEESDNVKMPIIHFPICEEWAQKLCEEFVALKMSVCFGNQTRHSVDEYMKANKYCVLPMGYGGKKAAPYQDRWRFYNGLSQFYNTAILLPSNNKEKCLIFSHYLYNNYAKYDSSDKFWYLKEIIGDEKSITDASISLSFLPYENTQNRDSNFDQFLYDALDSNDKGTLFPYLFLFLNKDMDGRNNPFCMSLQRETIKEYNEDFDAGIKKVFFIQFSSKPYRLQRIFETKHNLVERLQREKTSQTRDFISFTSEEMDFIFDRESHSTTAVISYEDNPSANEIKSIIDYIIQDYPHDTKLRNEMALCYSDRAQELFKQDMLEIDPDCAIENFTYFFGIMKYLLSSSAEVDILDFVKYQSVKVIVDYNVSAKFKHEFKDYLKQLGAVSVTFGTFKDFKRQKNGRSYINNISEHRILVMSILNHRTGRNWSIYPNSFDEFFVTPNQSVLFVNNLFAFDPRYSWYKFRYNEQYKLLLNSNFRTKYVKSGFQYLTRPEIKEPREDEDELTTRTQSSASTPRYQISFVGTRLHKTVFESEPLICKNGEESSIFSADEILKIFDDPTTLEVMPIADLYDVLKEWAAGKSQKEIEGESLIRSNPKYGLSEEEKKSKVELWKIMLKHKVEREGIDHVYGEIMSPLLPYQRIKMLSFERWLDEDSDAILPRNRKMQKRVLEEYLGIDAFYTRIMRLRKSRTSNNTESENKILRTFIVQCILTSDFEGAYSGLSDEICDYLDITSDEDVRDYVVEILRPKIVFKKIKAIKSI